MLRPCGLRPSAGGAVLLLGMLRPCGLRPSAGGAVLLQGPARPAADQGRPQVDRPQELEEGPEDEAPSGVLERRHRGERLARREPIRIARIDARGHEPGGEAPDLFAQVVDEEAAQGSAALARGAAPPGRLSQDGGPARAGEERGRGRTVERAGLPDEARSRRARLRDLVAEAEPLGEPEAEAGRAGQGVGPPFGREALLGQGRDLPPRADGGLEERRIRPAVPQGQGGREPRDASADDRDSHAGSASWISAANASMSSGRSPGVFARTKIAAPAASAASRAKMSRS